MKGDVLQSPSGVVDVCFEQGCFFHRNRREDRMKVRGGVGGGFCGGW